MGNIFEDIMAAHEFVDGVAEKMAKDWKETEDANEYDPDTQRDPKYYLYRWISGGFAESLIAAVRKKVEE